MDIFRYIGYGASIVGVFVLIMIAVERIRDLINVLSVTCSLLCGLLDY